MKEVLLSLDDIIKGQLNLSGSEHDQYTQEVLTFKNNNEGWISETKNNLWVKKLLQEGLRVGIAPLSCQVIRLCLNA